MAINERTARTGPNTEMINRHRSHTRGVTAKQAVFEEKIMCQYCNYGFADGWKQLIEYDEVYQQAMATTTEAEYGFHESWDELSEEVY